jgi:uncharacterized protein (TIGR04255 family)
MSIDDPHFRKPPVVEVVCGVQFSSAAEWQTTHFGSFWESMRGEYPEFEDHPPLEKLRIGGEPSLPEIRALPPLRRVFFIQPPGNFLMQLQPDRILHNWRKITESDQYPRFEAAYPRFVSSWQKLKAFTASANLPEPLPDAFELTYINHIGRAGAKFPRDVWDFLAFYETTPKAVIAKESSAMAMHFGWPLPDEAGILTFDLKHGVRASDENEVLLIELNARGKATTGGRSMDEWFGIAHRAIVNTFDALTTEAAHTLWEKTQP